MTRTLAAPVQQAIAWEVRLREGELDEAGLQSFARWREADPAHDAAWSSLQQRLGRLQGGQGPAPQAMAQALRADASERRRLLRTGFGVVALAILGAGGRHAWQEFGLDADWQSGIGVRRDVHLADGTPLSLDAGSRVYQSGSGDAVRLRLARGQVLLRAALAPGRTLHIESSGARVSLRQAVFNLSRFAHGSVLALDSGSAQLHVPGRAATLVEAGQTLYFHAGGVEARPASFAAVSAWTRGLFVADRLPLSDLVDVFNRYRAGLVRTSGAAGQRRISGVFRLDDIDRALVQVAEILPVHLRRYGPYLSVLS